MLLQVSQIVDVTVIAARSGSQRREIEELPIIIQPIIVKIINNLDIKDFFGKCSRGIGRPNSHAQDCSTNQGTEITVDPQDVSGNFKKPIVRTTFAFSKRVSKSITRCRISGRKTSNSRANRCSLGNNKTRKHEIIGAIGCNRRTNLQSINKDIVGRTWTSDRDNSFQGYRTSTIRNDIQGNDIVY